VEVDEHGVNRAGLTPWVLPVSLFPCSIRSNPARSQTNAYSRCRARPPWSWWSLRVCSATARPVVVLSCCRALGLDASVGADGLVRSGASIWLYERVCGNSPERQAPVELEVEPHGMPDGVAVRFWPCAGRSRVLTQDPLEGFKLEPARAGGVRRLGAPAPARDPAWLSQMSGRPCAAAPVRCGARLSAPLAGCVTSHIAVWPRAPSMRRSPPHPPHPSANPHRMRV
jgi:hypothetical protein